MELHVAAAIKQPGEFFEASLEQTFESERYGGRLISFAAPIRLSCRYSYDGKAITLVGELSFLLSSKCSRCNEAFLEPLTIPFTERFVKGTEGQEEDCYAFDGEILQLSQMVLDNLFLHMPLNSVCEQGCKGLCPVCGINLNKGRCACPPEEERKALSALGGLLNEDKEV